jgi:hypothetical protein
MAGLLGGAQDNNGFLDCQIARLVAELAAGFSESPSLAPATAEGVHSAIIQATEPAHLVPPGNRRDAA